MSKTAFAETVALGGRRGEHDERRASLPRAHDGGLQEALGALGAATVMSAIQALLCGMARRSVELANANAKRR